MNKSLLFIAVIVLIVIAIGIGTLTLRRPSQTPTPTQTTIVETTTPETSPTPTPPTTPTPSQPVELYVSHWGFAWDTINEVVIKPFEQKYNVKVVLISGTTADRYSKLVSGAEPTPDLVFLPDYYMYRAAKAGLLEELDYSKIPNAVKLADFIRQNYFESDLSKYAIPHTIQDMIIIYRSDKHPPVTSIKDLWRDDFKGLVLLPYITTTTGPMFLVLTNIAYGGNLTDMEPAFEVLETHKDYVVTYYTKSAEFNSVLERGEAEIAVGLRYQLGAVQGLNQTLSGKLSYVIPSEGSIFVFNVMAIPKNAKNKELAYKLIDFWLSTEVQQKLAEKGVDAPVNKEVVLPPEHYYNYMGQISRPIYLLPEVLAENLENWTSQWKARLS